MVADHTHLTGKRGESGSQLLRCTLGLGLSAEITHTKTPVERRIGHICGITRKTGGHGTLAVTGFALGHAGIVVGIDLHAESHRAPFGTGGTVVILLILTGLFIFGQTVGCG